MQKEVSKVLPTRPSIRHHDPVHSTPQDYQIKRRLMSLSKLATDEELNDLKNFLKNQADIDEHQAIISKCRRKNKLIETRLLKLQDKYRNIEATVGNKFYSGQLVEEKLGALTTTIRELLSEQFSEDQVDSIVSIYNTTRRELRLKVQVVDLKRE